jgi:hypothetical protein
MNRLTPLTQSRWFLPLLAFLLGLVLGLVVLGWYVFPVEWTNAAPRDLQAAWKETYVSMVADSFSISNEAAVAKQRLAGFDSKELGDILGKLISARQRENKNLEVARLQALAQATGIRVTLPAGAGGTPVPGATPTPGGAIESTSFLSGLLPIAGIFVLVVALIALGLLAFTRFRGRLTLPSFGRGEAGGAAAGPSTPTAGVAPTRAPGLGHHVATYALGQDNYDTSFSLETPRGEFLGECGMGISETIGDGKPDKVVAFDLWLFDKGDVRTITQVLMSEYAYNNPTLRSKLTAKGEPVLAQPGNRITLETVSLRVDAEITDVVYAATAGLAPRSHFQKLVVEMVPTTK